MQRFKCSVSLHLKIYVTFCSLSPLSVWILKLTRMDCLAFSIKLAPRKKNSIIWSTSEHGSINLNMAITNLFFYFIFWQTKPKNTLNFKKKQKCHLNVGLMYSTLYLWSWKCDLHSCDHYVPAYSVLVHKKINNRKRFSTELLQWTSTSKSFIHLLYKYIPISVEQDITDYCYVLLAVVSGETQWFVGNAGMGRVHWSCPRKGAILKGPRKFHSLVERLWRFCPTLPKHKKTSCLVDIPANITMQRI